MTSLARAADLDAAIERPVAILSYNFFSQLAQGMAGLVIPLIATERFAATPERMGVFIAIGRSPYLLAIFVGVVVDYVSRRRVLMAGCLARIMLFAGCGLATYWRSTTIWGVAAVSAVACLILLHEQIAETAYVHEIVARARLVKINGLINAWGGAAAALATISAGWVYEHLGSVAAVFSVAALSAPAFLALRLTASGRATDRSQIGLPKIADLLYGLRIIAMDRGLCILSAYATFSTLFFSISGTLFVLFLSRTCALGPAQIGLVMAISSAGRVMGPLFADKLHRAFSSKLVFTGAALLLGASWLAVAIAPSVGGLTLLGIGVLLGSVALAIYNVLSVSYRQATTPQEYQGRVVGALRFVGWSVIPLGSLLSGLLAQRLGVQAAFYIMGAGLILCTPLLIALPRDPAQ